MLSKLTFSSDINSLINDILKIIRLLFIIVKTGFLAFSISWIIKTSSSLWKQAVGVSILFEIIVVFVLIIISIASLILLFLKDLKNMKIIFYYSTIIMFVFCANLLYLSNQEASERYHNDIQDFTKRFPNNSYVIKFKTDYSTEYSIDVYIRKQVGTFHVPLEVFLGFMILCFLVHSGCEIYNEFQENPIFRFNEPQAFIRKDELSSQEIENQNDDLIIKNQENSQHEDVDNKLSKSASRESIHEIESIKNEINNNESDIVDDDKKGSGDLAEDSIENKSIINQIDKFPEEECFFEEECIYQEEENIVEADL